MDEADQIRGPSIEIERSGSSTVFLAGGGIGLLLGLVIGSIIGSLLARPIAAAVRSLRRRITADDEPHFEFLAQ